MNFSIKRINEEREHFGCYKYRIFNDNVAIAEFWHNYRGEPELYKDYQSGIEEDPPFGRCSDFINGGGPKPIELSKSAIKYIESKFVL